MGAICAFYDSFNYSYLRRPDCRDGGGNALSKTAQKIRANCEDFRLRIPYKDGCFWEKLRLIQRDRS